MVEKESAFREVIGFLDDIGIYDVVLPFLLVFTIMFAILEKTRLFGTDEVEGKKYTKKNINAMVAFVSSFFVVASTQLVEVINQAVANIALLLLLIVLFLMLIATFYKEGEEPDFPSGLKIVFGVVIFICILLIFFNSLGWLSVIGDFFADNINEPWFVSIIFAVVIIIIIVLITMDNKPVASKSRKIEEESS